MVIGIWVIFACLDKSMNFRLEICMFCTSFGRAGVAGWLALIVGNSARAVP